MFLVQQFQLICNQIVITKVVKNDPESVSNCKSCLGRKFKFAKLLIDLCIKVSNDFSLAMLHVRQEGRNTMRNNQSPVFQIPNATTAKLNANIPFSSIL